MNGAPPNLSSLAQTDAPVPASPSQGESLFLSSPSQGEDSGGGPAALDIGALLVKAATRPAEPYGFGEIRWLVSGALDPNATMTIGVCRIELGKGNPLHYHPNCDEVLYVISGRCRNFIGSQSVEMGPGDCIRIPRGVPHRAETPGAAPMVCLIAYDTPQREVVFLGGPQARADARRG